MADDLDEFFDIVGTDPALHVRCCPEMMFPEDGFPCPAILTSREDLQFPSSCLQCDHRYTRCDCTEKIFPDQDMICWGDEEACPYRKMLGRPVEDAYMTAEKMDEMLERQTEKPE